MNPQPFSPKDLDLLQQEATLHVKVITDTILVLVTSAHFFLFFFKDGFVIVLFSFSGAFKQLSKYAIKRAVIP